MAKDIHPLERAARALCQLDGRSDDNQGSAATWQDYVPRARAVIEEAAMRWRPIESAPQSGCSLLLYVPAEKNPDRRVIVGAWDKPNRRWTVIPAIYGIQPSHWLPLPPDPTD